MKRLLSEVLCLALALLAMRVEAEEIHWRAAKPRAVAASQPADPNQQSLPVVWLGQPIPMAQASGNSLDKQPFSDRQITPVACSSPVALDAPRVVVRAQSPDPILAPPVPPAVPVVPGPTEEPYNSGVVTSPAPNNYPFLDRVRDWLNAGEIGGGGRAPFQSDHGFDVFISPVTNPFLFEDPRALTEIRPIFMLQGAPSKNPIFQGGDIEFFGLQARLAVTDRLSVVLNKAGFDWIEPHHQEDGFAAHDGFSELWLGPKYTFFRNEQTGTLAAAGLTFQIPAGPAKVLQDTGTLSLEPYASFGQNFFKTAYGSLNFLNTTGYTLGVDDKRTDYFFSSFHLDYDYHNLHKIYPLLELNWTHYTSAGNARDLAFEGRDLFNFGAHGVSGADFMTLAPGFRFKVSEALQTGVAYEFPITGRHDLLDYRLTFDVILRY